MSRAVVPVWPEEMDEPAAEQPQNSEGIAGDGEPSAAAVTTAQAIAQLLASVLGPGALPIAEGVDTRARDPGIPCGGHRTLN